jgi:predicted TIM-barrel fold metal-dependent hydrolase
LSSMPEATLVDCDIHPFPPLAELGSLLSARTRQQLERYGRRTPSAIEFYPRAANGGFRTDSWPDGGPPGSNLDLLRAQLLDEFGIDYGILNTLNLMSFHEPPEIAADLAHAMNDWMQGWLEAEPRLLGAIVLPYEYPELAVQELELRADDPRWVQVILADSPEQPLGSRAYWPIYEAAAAHGLPVAIHTAGMSPHLPTGWPSFYLEDHVGNAMRMQAQLLNLVCEGTFTAIPGLRIVSTESGVAWSAWLAWALDSAWERLGDSAPPLDAKPSELIREHVWFTTQPIEEPADPQEFARLVDQADLGERLLFATDYPHWDFDSPSQALPPSLSKEARAKILGGNAARLYGLPLP